MIIILKYFVIWIILTKVVLSNELDCLVNDKSINHEIDNDNDNDINNDIDKCIDYSDIENCGCSLPKDTLKTYLNNVDDIELIEDCSSKGDCCGKTPLDMIDIQTCHNIDKITHLASSDSIISNSRNIFNNNNISIEDMVLIPNGTFIMGTNNPLIVGDGEGPKRSVIISTSFLLDIYEVSNHKFKEFIDSTNYITESELFGWSFVFNTAVPNKIKNKISQAVLGAEWWLPVDKSYWKQPEGPDTDVFTTNRGDYPVVQVSWNDANQYCLWRGGRLPSEAEWEFAANGGKQGNKFPWGNKLTTKGKHRANIYQGKFPTNNTGYLKKYIILYYYTILLYYFKLFFS